MDGGKKVWVPDNEHGFRLGEIVDLGSDTISVEVDGAKGKVWIAGIVTTHYFARSAKNHAFCLKSWREIYNLNFLVGCNGSIR